MRKKRKPALPRVTLLAFDRKALLAFSESVEALRHLVADLRIVAEDLKAAAAAKPKSRGKKQTLPPAAPVAAGPEAPSIDFEVPNDQS